MILTSVDGETQLLIERDAREHAFNGEHRDEAIHFHGEVVKRSSLVIRHGRQVYRVNFTK